ncbi:MAG: hypothetical protein IKD69_12585 [Solobacterium sp.]|nr:hypothetical protein [Solobacterium sp.]
MTLESIALYMQTLLHPKTFQSSFTAISKEHRIEESLNIAHVKNCYTLGSLSRGWDGNRKAENEEDFRNCNGMHAYDKRVCGK